MLIGDSKYTRLVRAGIVETSQNTAARKIGVSRNDDPPGPFNRARNSKFTVVAVLLVGCRFFSMEANLSWPLAEFPGLLSSMHQRGT